MHIGKRVHIGDDLDHIIDLTDDAVRLAAGARRLPSRHGSVQATTRGVRVRRHKNKKTDH